MEENAACALEGPSENYVAHIKLKDWPPCGFVQPPRRVSLQTKYVVRTNEILGSQYRMISFYYERY